MKPAKETISNALRALLLTIPYFRKVYEVYKSSTFLPGHYYSTIPLLKDVEKNEKRIFENENIRDINLYLDEQFQLLQELTKYYDTIPFNFNGSESNHLRYIATEDAYYRYSDVIFLFCLMRHFQPKKIIEVGSGHSSAVMLDTNEIFFQNKIDLTFIEPYPEERLYGVLRKSDEQKTSIIRNFVQDKEVDFFQSLDENDILFIDSSHVSKVGSDVNYTFFDILPILKPGVLIHFHDIFFPFELPKHWICESKFFWNENYLLRAFLMNNHDYKIVLFNSLLQKKYRRWFEEKMPDCLKGSSDTGSIWIRKVKQYAA